MLSGGLAAPEDGDVDPRRAIAPDSESWATLGSGVTNYLGHSVAQKTMALEDVALRAWKEYMSTVVRASPDRAPSRTLQDEADDRELLSRFFTWIIRSRDVLPSTARLYVDRLVAWFSRERGFAFGGRPERTAGKRTWIGRLEHGAAIDRQETRGVHRKDKKPPIQLTHLHVIGSRHDPSDADQVVMRAALALGYEGLFRISEISQPSKARADHDNSFNFKVDMSRGDLTWFTAAGKCLAPTAAGLSALADGDYALLVLGPSKADRLAKKYGQQPMELVYSSGNISNAARELAAMEIALPCLGAARIRAPIFTLSSRASGSARVWLTKHRLFAQAASWLKGAGLPPITGRSLRIGGLCALLAAGVPEWEIQRIGRWSSNAWMEYMRAAPAGRIARLRQSIGSPEALNLTADYMLLPAGRPGKGAALLPRGG